jgi:hypothetical protein
MKKSTALTTPQETISKYVAACREGNVEKLRSLFSPAVLMSGLFGGELYIGLPDIFFDTVRDNPSPTSTGVAYTSEITSSENLGNIATVTLKEQGYLGSNFTNLFQLAHINESWIIVSKLYVDE